MRKSDEETRLAKLDKPPAVHNFVRCIRPTVEGTASHLAGLALGFPKVSYQWATNVIKGLLEFGQSEQTALDILFRITPAHQLDANLEVLNAFFAHHRIREYDCVRVYDEFSGYFQAGAYARVPVKPIAVLRERGKLIPLFLIPWSSVAFDSFQCRLLMSLYEDAIFSLTDFRDSSGEVLLLPRSADGSRVPVVWYRETFDLLSPEELSHVVRNYVEAREAAVPILVERLAKRKERRAAKAATASRAAEEAKQPKK